MKWRQLEYNSVLDGDGFFISFNPGAKFLSHFNSLFGEANNPTPETALINVEDGRRVFRILNGDSRKEYENLAPLGWDACLSFFHSQSDKFGSGWSTNYEDRRTELK